MTQNQMIIVLTLLMVITTVEGIKFNFELEGYAKRCFSELLSIHFEMQLRQLLSTSEQKLKLKTSKSL